MNQKNTMYGGLFSAAGVVYPMLIYFVVLTLAMNLCTAIAIKLGVDPQQQYMALQTVATVITLPFIFYFYRKDRKQPTACQMHLSQIFEGKSRKEKIFDGVMMFLTGALAGITLNNLVAMTAIKQISEGYQKVETNFFSGGILFEIIGSCLLIPILEEMLYRSVIYGRICDIFIPYQVADTEEKKKRNSNCRVMAIVFTAMIFGVMHMNIVQFIYATILGLMLSWFVEKSGHLLGAVVAHVGANLMSVLRMETPILKWMESSKTCFILSTVICIVITIALLIIIKKCSKNNAEEV